MHVEISVPEVVELFNEICLAPEKLFEMIRLDLRKAAGKYLAARLEEELTFCRGLSGAFPKSLFELRPEEEWLSLRTTNIIERLNKDFKSRTEPMEIVAGE